MKKTLSIILALALVLSFGFTFAFAEGTGSITIENATPGVTYEAFKVFDYTQAGDSYAYTIKDSDAFYSDVVAATSLFTLTASAADSTVFVVERVDDVTDEAILTWLQGLTGHTTENTEAAADGQTTVVFENLDYGYYYVTSSLGDKAISVTHMNNAVTIHDKNQNPTLEKTVSDAADGTFAETSTASIGDTVYFKVESIIPKYVGAEEVLTYKYVDTIDDAFTLNEDSIIVSIVNGETPVTANVTTDTTTEPDKIIVTINNVNTTEGFTALTKLVLTYNALLDKDATPINPNDVTLDWAHTSDDQLTTPELEDHTKTFTYAFNVKKVKGDKTALDGAKFELYDAVTNGNKINLVKIEDGKYRLADKSEYEAVGFESAIIEAGEARIFGLKDNDYYLEEIEAPNGYNILTARQKVELVEVAYGESINITADEATYQTEEVINLSGSALPETGGIGTTLFYVIGSALVLGAAIILVARRRRDCEA